MKLGKRLKRQIEETLPECKEKFLSYKDLKKLVRLISAAQLPSKVEAEFIQLLDTEIVKSSMPSSSNRRRTSLLGNGQEQQERIKRVIQTHGPGGSQPSDSEYAKVMSRIRKDVVNFHGEMVLLENYSNVNYTGLGKILKKYDKRTGRLLRLPFIEKVLKQPFFKTDLVSKLVKECENTLDLVFPIADQEQPEQGGKITLVAAEQSIFRSTIAALTTMQELRKGSSTYSYFSLPPLSLPDIELLHSLQLPSPIPIL
ncbi:hypothetical protein ZIOFF_050680 [Zingiber officinale]|uniref:SPX domain-containing protein n=1 Tax=Zingiber officinale TaxID=94328 RepID=A0A8J5FQ88_ZINOF|nr:hypothetical protein ZIOFF_050680 [Zingiber officinale]